MPTASLLLREANASTTSLSSLVEKSQQKRPPLPEYDLRLRSSQLDLVLLKNPTTTIASKPSLADEGFESDIDSLSIVSSDDSFTNNAPKTETDSANGSSYSDSDDNEVKTPQEPTKVPTEKESFDLVKCSCYSDVKFPDLLVFVIKEEALVFKFGNLEDLQKFYSSFNTLKAVANQKAYCEPLGTKFNLLQRTDNNGVTHIEISREPKVKIDVDYEPSSIISINTPENYIHEKILEKMRVSDQRSTLRKVWNSSEDILDAPKKPERRKKMKGKAPPPPIEENILKGEFIRVNVAKLDQKPLVEKPKPFNILGTAKPKLTTYQQFKFSEPKRLEPQRKVSLESWTSSMPRVAKNGQRSRSETRNFTPMAYRYIDTTQGHLNRRQHHVLAVLPPQPITNRLFGMSSKLKDFGKFDADVRSENGRWNSLGELVHKENNLKSVIKKEEGKRKNEKKVTFSAYATVQVV